MRPPRRPSRLRRRVRHVAAGVVHFPWFVASVARRPVAHAFERLLCGLERISGVRYDQAPTVMEFHEMERAGLIVGDDEVNRILAQGNVDTQCASCGRWFVYDDVTVAAVQALITDRHAPRDRHVVEQHMERFDDRCAPCIAERLDNYDGADWMPEEWAGGIADNH